MACGGPTHRFSRCFLVLGIEKDWLSQEARDTFTNNIKVLIFWKKVEDLRKKLAAIKAAKNK